MSERTFGLVPIRGLTNGKTRLAEEFTVEARSALTRRMLRGVIEAASGSGELELVGVVSPDTSALAYARSIDERVIPIVQRADAPGLNPAVTAGRDWAAKQGADGLLVLFGDLPMLASPDVREIVRQPEQVVLAPDRHGTGTNALLVRLAGRGADFIYQYGAGSAGRHAGEAARLGLSFAWSRSPGTEFDLDTPDDWKTLLATDQRLVHVGSEEAIAMALARPGNAAGGDHGR